MEHIVSGLKLLLRDRRLLRYVAIPMAYAVVFFVVVIVAGYFLIVPAVSRLLSGLGVNIELTGILGTLIYLAILFLVSGMLFLTLAATTSSFLWDRLSMEVERSIGVEPAEANLPTTTLIADSIVRVAVALGLAIVAFGCGFLLPGVIGILAAGLVGLFDFTASPYLRRGITWGEQRRKVFRLRGSGSYLLVAGLLSLLPLVNVLALPALVAGGTLMFHRGQPTPVAPA